MGIKKFSHKFKPEIRKRLALIFPKSTDISQPSIADALRYLQDNIQVHPELADNLPGKEKFYGMFSVQNNAPAKGGDLKLLAIIYRPVIEEKGLIWSERFFFPDRLIKTPVGFMKAIPAERLKDAGIAELFRETMRHMSKLNSFIVYNELFDEDGDMDDQGWDTAYELMMKLIRTFNLLFNEGCSDLEKAKEKASLEVAYYEKA